MLGKILNSNKTLDEKIDDLYRFSSGQDFLDTLACPNGHALRDVIAFAKEVFMRYPPDTEFQLGPANDRRVFMIRLLTRLNYSNYCSVSSDVGVGTELLHLVYDLLARENIFNRYLSLRMLYPLLRPPIPVDFALHLKLMGSFFRNELPQSDDDDPSKCELGFFIISEVLVYLKEFQQTYQLDPSSYEGVFSILTATLHTYYRPHGLLTTYADNKKIMCEYSSAAVRLLDFINMFPATPLFYESVPEVCSSLALGCPSDCYALRKDAVRVIVDAFSARPEIFGNIEKYFTRNAFTSTCYVPLQTYILHKLSEVISLFIRVDRASTMLERDVPARPNLPHVGLSCDMLYKSSRTAKNRLPVLNKIIFSEFDSRISEYLPQDNNSALISACLSAYKANLSLLKVCTMTPVELKMAVVRNIRHAYRIYQLIHKEEAIVSNGISANDLLAREILGDIRQPTMVSLLAQLTDYILLVLQTIPMLHLPSGMLEIEDLMILSKFILLPLNSYSGYRNVSIGNGPAAARDDKSSTIGGRPALSTSFVDGSYYRSFFTLPPDDLDYIMRSCANDILVKYYNRVDLWSVLTENFVANIRLIRTANRLIHRDFVYGNYKHLEFYQYVFPVAYSFFKLDKKYFKSDFTELFSVTYQCALEMGLEDEGYAGGNALAGKEGVDAAGRHVSQQTGKCGQAMGRCANSRVSAEDRPKDIADSRYIAKSPVTTKDIYDILNKMFLAIKACESAYTGLYFIYNNFEKSINELYDLYTLTNDLFYIECLFNIPVSLNLLVTKYNLLIKPMEVAMRSTARLREIVMKYIEYIIEFDNVSGMMDGLLMKVYKLLRYDDLKGMRVLSRISNIHRAALSKDEVKIARLRDSYRITVPWELSIAGVETGGGRYAAGGDGGKADSVGTDVHRIQVNISIDKSVSSLIRGYVGVAIEHSFLHIRSSGILETLYTRTLSVVDVDRVVRESARMYLLRYLLGMLGYYEYLKGDVEVLEGESSRGYVLNDMFVLSKEREEGLSYYVQYYVSVGDILLALYMDDSCSVMEVLSGFMRSYVRYVLRSKQQTSSGYKVFVDVLLDGFVYAPRRSKEMVLLFYRLLDEEYARCGRGDADGNGNDVPSGGGADVWSNGIGISCGVYACNMSPDAVDGTGRYDIRLHELKNRFVCERICEIVNLVYLEDDLKSIHALQAIKFYIETATFYVDDKVCPVVMYAVRYKLLRTKTYRMYELCLNLMVAVFSKFELMARSYYETVFNMSSIEQAGSASSAHSGCAPGSSDSAGVNTAASSNGPSTAGGINTNYVRLLHCELEYLFGVNPLFDLPVELDRRSALRILKLPKYILGKYHNLVTLTENLLKITERTDSYAIKVYSAFIGQMSYDSSKFNDLLAPAKKYLPSVAVMEGFSSLESKRKFVETVNRNGHLQNSNPNSFRVFRNLFYGCQMAASIKSNFIEIYNNQMYSNDTKYVSVEHRKVIYDTLLYSKDYDLATLDFLLTKIVDIVDGDDYRSILSVICGRLANYNGHNDNIGHGGNANAGGINTSTNSRLTNIDISRYLVEHIHLYHVYQLVCLFIPFHSISSHLLQWLTEYYYAAAASSLPNFTDRVVQSKRAYYILRYLQANSCRFENNRLILLVYRDLYCDYPCIMDLINYYFVGFTTEELDLLYRINPSAVVDSPALLEKVAIAENDFVRAWLLHSLERKHRSVSGAVVSAFTPIGSIARQRVCRSTSTAVRFDDLSDSSGVDSLFIEDSTLELSDSVSYEPSLSEAVVGDSDDGNWMGEDGMDDGVSADNSFGGGMSDSSAMDNNPSAYVSAGPSSPSVPPAAILTTIVDTLGSIDNLPLLPVIEFFINTRCRSDHVIFLCKSSLDNVSVRFAALHYLCMFDPSPDYAALVFKLNFQERVYAVDCLLLLLDRFGVEMFVPTLAAVVRSEMRFMTSKEIILPVVILRPALIDNEGLYFELCVMAYRLFSREVIDYSLFSLIRSRSAMKGDDGTDSAGVAGRTFNANGVGNAASIITELSTLVILYEFVQATFRIFYDCKDFAFGRVLRELTKMCANRNDNKNDIRIGAMFVYIDRHIDGGTGCSGASDSVILRHKRDILELFVANPAVALTKRVILWLYGSNGRVGVSSIMNAIDEGNANGAKNSSSYTGSDNYIDANPEDLTVFLSSTMDNQVNLLELLLSANHFIPLIFSLLKELVRQGYPNINRFVESLTILINVMPGQIADWMLADKSVQAYPVLAEHVADLIPKVDSITAVSLCLLRFTNTGRNICGNNGGHGNGPDGGYNNLDVGCGYGGGNDHSNIYPASTCHAFDLDTIYLTNYMHLFKYYSSALPFRTEFYKGCSSCNKILRHSYMNLFYSQIPADAYSTIEFVLRHDWRDIPSGTVEFMIAVAFLRTLKLTRKGRLHRRGNLTGSGGSACDGHGRITAANSTLEAMLRQTFHGSFDGMLDMFYYCTSSASFVTNFLLVTFKLLGHHSLQRLYILHSSSNLTAIIGNCFIQAFDSRNISCGDIYFNPYNPSMRFYSNMADRAMYYGMVKTMSALRETKIVAKLSLLGRHEQALDKIYEVFEGVEKRTISYKKEDLRILESELRYIYDEYEMSIGSDGFKGVAVNGSVRGNRSGAVRKAVRSENVSGDVNAGGRSGMGSNGIPGGAVSPGSTAGRGLLTDSPTHTVASPPRQINGITTASNSLYSHDNPYKESLFDSTHPFYSTFTKKSTIEDINYKFNLLIGKIVQSDNILSIREDIEDMIDGLKSSLYVMCYIPRSSHIFSRLLMYATICFEINESLLILHDSHNDSIYGRFRMWMVRHPSFLADLVDWSLFMRWRMFIFNHALSYVPDNDKKKISSEICKLTYLYASKAFKEKLYSRASHILNSINNMPTIELQQNTQKYMLDIESLFACGEYGTVVSLINSINVNRLLNEDRSRLYYWASRAFARLHKMNDSDRFGGLSRKVGEIMENKKEYLRMVRELIDEHVEGGGFDGLVGNAGNNMGGGKDTNNIAASPAAGRILNGSPSVNLHSLKNIYASKLIEIINELPIDESKIYVMDFIENREYSRIEQIQPEKLYFFIPQLGMCGEHLMSNNLIRTSFSSIRVFERLHRRQSGKWKEYYGLKRKFKAYMDGDNAGFDDNDGTGSAANNGDGGESAASNVHTGAKHFSASDINRLFELELKYNFEISNSSLLLHTFDYPTTLPGQFSCLRNEYENIKTMCYVENFYSAYNEAEGIFFVRNMDGSISKVQLHNNSSGGGAAKNADNSANDIASNTSICNSQINQLLQLLNYNIKCHDLDRAGFDVSVANRISNATIHDRMYFSIDSVIKLQLFRKHIKFSRVALECVRVRKEMQAGFARAALEWQDLLRREMVERLVTSCDFYMFRNKFVNSYSSLIAVQYLLGICNVSLGGTFIEEVSGSVFAVDGASAGNGGDGMDGDVISAMGNNSANRSAANNAEGTGENNTCAAAGMRAEKFYLRPNIGYLFGDEGKNGPLVLILSKFAEAYLNDSSNSSVVKFFLGRDKAIECSKRMSRLVFDGVDEGCNSAELAIGEMVDPKTGLSMKMSEMAWV